MAVVADNNSNKGPQDGGGARTISGGTVTLDASQGALAFSGWDRNRATVGPLASAIGTQVGDTKPSDSVNVSVSDTGLVTAKNGDDNPFAVVAPDAGMIITQTRGQKGTEERARVRMRVGFLQGGSTFTQDSSSQTVGNCSAGDFNGTYRVKNFAVDLDDSNTGTNVEIGHETASGTFDVTDGAITVSQLVWANIGIEFSNPATLFGGTGTDSGTTIGTTVNPDCTLTVDTVDGSSPSNNSPAGIISPDGKSMALVTFENDGTFSDMFIGFKDES